MSSESQSNMDDHNPLLKPGASIWLSYYHPHHGEQCLAGEIESVQDDQVLIHVNSSAKYSRIYVASCDDWDEELTVCHRDWRRIGRVVVMTVEQILV